MPGILTSLARSVTTAPVVGAPLSPTARKVPGEPVVRQPGIKFVPVIEIVAFAPSIAVNVPSKLEATQGANEPPVMLNDPEPALEPSVALLVNRTLSNMGLPVTLALFNVTLPFPSIRAVPK